MRNVMMIGSLALMAAACAPATVQTARTNGQGNFQFGIEPGVVGAVTGGGSAFGPAVNFAGRYGVSDRVDVGGRLGTGVYEVQVKAMVSDPAAADDMAISVAPSTTLFAGSVGGVGGLYLREHVPVLFGLPTGGGSEFTFGPSATLNMVGGGGGGGSASATVLSLGGQVGYAARLGDNFRLVPQFDLSVPVAALAGATGAGTDGGVGVGVGVVGFQLGLLFGGYK